MFVTKSKLAAAVVLSALMGHGTCRGDAGIEDKEGLAEVALTTFPDGLEHDFGPLPRGAQAEHAFRIVNTSAVPLRIVSLRFG
jgi:hypothetical protein